MHHSGSYGHISSFNFAFFFVQRSKAEVDKDKLREIEEQDKRLAQIIEEQEKIRLKKAKQKWKQQQDLKRAQV